MRTKDAANWPTAHEDQLRHLWDVEGLSSGDIAKIMGRTRNAIIGKVGRLHLSKRLSRIQPRIKLPPRLRYSHKKTGDGALSKRLTTMQLSPNPVPGDTKALKGWAWVPLPDTTPVPLVDLETGMCKWPVTEDRPHLFCGAAANGVYCEHHAALSFGLGTISERMAAREAA